MIKKVENLIRKHKFIKESKKIYKMKKVKKGKFKAFLKRKLEELIESIQFEILLDGPRGYLTEEETKELLDYIDEVYSEEEEKKDNIKKVIDK